MNNDDIITELGSEAVLNYERITALFYLLVEKGIITEDITNLSRRQDRLRPPEVRFLIVQL